MDLRLVCQNFVNVLYWNYSDADKQPMFTVNLETYLSEPETLETSELFLDISSISRDVTDSYIVSVSARIGSETSEMSSIKFSYSTDMSDGNTQMCLLDFPAVNVSINKDLMEVSFQHPSLLHKQDLFKDVFSYTVSVDEKTASDECFEEDDQCITQIHLNQSAFGRCLQLELMGRFASIPSYTNRTICTPQKIQSNGNIELIAALLCGGMVLIFITPVMVWLFYKNWSKVPKIPEFMHSMVVSRSPSTLIAQPYNPQISQMTSMEQRVVLTDDSDVSPVSVEECGSEIDVALMIPEEDNESPDSLGNPSGYDCAKFPPLLWCVHVGFSTNLCNAVSFSTNATSPVLVVSILSQSSTPTLIYVLIRLTSRLLQFYGCRELSSSEFLRPEFVRCAFEDLRALMRAGSNRTEAAMLEEDMEVAIKVVVVGNGAVGKSSMIQRYCKGIFTRDYKKTIGVDFLERQIIVNGEDVRLMLWDTAGQEEFDAITKAYYRGAQACVLVFSTTDRDSFEAIGSWKEKVEVEVGDIPTVLVQNKIDLLDDTVIKNEEAEGLAKRLKLRFYRASVKEDLNVNEVFKYLADKYLQRLKQQSAEETEVHHSSSNKIGVFNTTGSNTQQKSSDLNGRDVISLRPNKQRTKKSKKPFGSCRLL
ncbi:hypothetical protein DNTS_014060 [Danionella cerebrum]|uniref:Ras-related protein Rab-23 n=1 Tax=Danionella cerebrum TaxID=2873325 RepID=A0A553NIK6_9TELE|nr:hypothetical protein DNTS_014060 [Danionella translucida]